MPAHTGAEGAAAMATTTTEKATTNRIGSLLADMAGEQAAAKGKKSTAVQVSAPQLQPHIERWIAAKAQADAAKATMETEGDQIISAAQPLRLAWCAKQGRVESTVRINGALSMTQKCQYCDIGAEHAPALDDAFGETERGRYFADRLAIALTDEAAADEGVLSDLVAALGPDRFRQVFKVSRWLEPTESFHADYTTREEVQQQAAELMSLQIIKPYKPALRV